MHVRAPRAPTPFTLQDELAGRQLAVVDSGIDGGEGKLEGREQAVILYDEEMNVTVVQPNEDGSYWRKIVRNKVAACPFHTRPLGPLPYPYPPHRHAPLRNKVVRMKEKRREKAAMNFLVKNFNADKEQIKLTSSWGPYTTTSGIAKNTGVPGVTAPMSAGKPEKASKSSGDD